MKKFKYFIFILFSIIFFLLGFRAFAFPTADLAHQNTTNWQKQQYNIMQTELLNNIETQIKYATEFQIKISLNAYPFAIRLNVIKFLEKHGYEIVKNGIYINAPDEIIIRWDKK